MKKYKYARKSKPKQKFARQIKNLQEFCPEGELIKECYTGTTQERPLWQRLMGKVQEGDTIIFDSVSRMSRNSDEGVADYLALYNKGVHLIFLKEPNINTDVYKETVSRYKFEHTGQEIDFVLEGIERFLIALAEKQIRIAFDQAEKEVADIQQRTKEGLAAIADKKQLGRKKGTKITTKKSIKAKKFIAKHAKAFGGTMTNVQVMDAVHISKNTFYKYVQEIIEEERDGKERV